MAGRSFAGSARRGRPAGQFRAAPGAKGVSHRDPPAPAAALLQAFLLGALALDAFPFLVFFPHRPAERRRWGGERLPETRVFLEERGKLVLIVEYRFRVVDRPLGPQPPVPIIPPPHERAVVHRGKLAMPPAVLKQLLRLVQLLSLLAHLLAHREFVPHERLRRAALDSVWLGRHQVAGSLVLRQEEAVPAGLPDAVLHGLARGRGLRRQVVENGGALDALDRALDLRPAAERREMRRVAIVPEELASAPQGALRLAVPARVPPPELYDRLPGVELSLRPLQQRVAPGQAGVEPPGQLSRFALGPNKRFVLLQNPSKRRWQPLPGLPLVVPDAVKQRVVARCMEGVESLSRSGIRMLRPVPQQRLRSIVDPKLTAERDGIALDLLAHGGPAQPVGAAHCPVVLDRRRRSRRIARVPQPLLRARLRPPGEAGEFPGRWWDLIVTMDDATSTIYSAFFVEEEGTMSSLRALSEVIGVRGLFGSLYADRASHYWHTPEAGGKVDKDNPTQVGRALMQLGIELIPAYSPEARGRSERMFGTLQKRLPQELRLAGITEMAEANCFLKEVYLPLHNARFAVPAEGQGSAFVPFAGALDDILCVHADRVVGNDNTVRYRGLTLQIPPDRHRHHYVKARVRVHEYPDRTLALFHGPRCLARYNADGEPIETPTRQAA